MTWVLFTLGLLIKTIYISHSDYRKKDIQHIALAVAAAITITVAAYIDSEPGEKLSAFAVLPLVYILCIAFSGFKDRLLPVVTEGKFLLYGLVGTYFYVLFGLREGVMASPLYFFGSLLFLLYLCLAIALITSSLRLKKLFQASTMVMFIVMSMYITVSMLPFSGVIMHPIWAIVVGFSCLSLGANILYLLYLIPITAKDQTMSDRLQELGRHLSDFEKNYYDTDAPKKDLLIIGGLCVLYFLLEIVSNLETLVIIAIIFTLAELLQKKRDELVEFHS